MRIKLEILNNGESFLKVPDEVLVELGWKTGDELVLDVFPAYRGAKSDTLMLFKATVDP